MNEHQIDALQIVVNNDVILSAVKHVFDATLARSLPSVHATESDEVVGQKYRAYDSCRLLINEAFRTLEACRKETVDKHIDDRHI